MSVATIKLVNEQFMTNFYFTKNPEDLARQLLTQRLYRVQGSMGVQGMEGMEAAEEVFDLTNNPSRQKEREELYGQGRSISVGDIVNVDGVDWLCCSQGWWQL